MDNQSTDEAPGHHRGMLRLHPGNPPLWRDATTVQFGVDAVVTLEHPLPWQERLIAELERGVPRAVLEGLATALGASRDETTEFLRLVGPALADEPPPPRRLVVVAAVGIALETIDATAHAMSSSRRFAVERAWRPADAAPGDDAVFALLAHHVVHPRDAAALMRSDAVHVPIVFSGSRTEVGPVVVPGVTPCLACEAAHRRDADPAWPQLAAQLVGRRSVPVDPAEAWEAGLTATRLLDQVLGVSAAPNVSSESSSVILYAASPLRSLRSHVPHADCGCRSPAGTSTAADPVRRETTTVRAFAQPA